ncbi:MAG: TetR/AcrR family transcriptional regulator [Treponemataceae bacterium]|nr:TetR/AcrR family transcriptional regulator [Treponemataceae bacterium]
MEKSSETKKFILETATRLFAAKGYDGVGVQEICNESSITKPTLYYYFTSKSGLLSAILEETGSQMLESFEKSSEYRHDFIGSLTSILKGSIEFATLHPDFYRLSCALQNVSSESESGKIYRDFSEKLEGIFQRFFENSVSEIGNMKGKEILFSRIFFQTCQAVSMDMISGRFQNENEISSSIIHSFAYGVVAG